MLRFLQHEGRAQRQRRVLASAARPMPMLSDAKTARCAGQHQQRAGASGQFGERLGDAAVQIAVVLAPIPLGTLPQCRGNAHPFGAIVIAMLEEMLGNHHRQPRPRSRRGEHQSASAERDEQRDRLCQFGIIAAGDARDGTGQRDHDQIGGGAQQDQRARRGGARQAHPLAPDVHRGDDIDRQREQYDRRKQGDQRRRDFAGQRTDQLDVELIGPQHREPAGDRHHGHALPRARMANPGVDHQQPADRDDRRGKAQRRRHPWFGRRSGAQMRRRAK